ncbi:MAG: nucleotidyltransferase domain-containing protein [Elusimicrobia bacterium]|nr:nucleotidyltransferase domain-containing protein [Elusimicrobiota bacterium]
MENNNLIIEGIKKKKSELIKKYNIEKIGLFGSYAKNTQRKDSDIDIVIQLKRQDLFDMIGIKQELEEEFRRKVDIVSYRNKMNPFLRNRIDKEAIYV